jgi:hypothetical protein
VPILYTGLTAYSPIVRSRNRPGTEVGIIGLGEIEHALRGPLDRSPLSRCLGYQLADRT